MTRPDDEAAEKAPARKGKPAADYTRTERSTALRQRRAEGGLAEIRGLWAPPALHAQIKAEVRRMLEEHQQQHQQDASA